MVSKRGKKKEEKKAQKRSRSKPSEIEKNKKGRWAMCSDCGVSLKSKNLSSHLKKVHGYVSDSKIKEIKKASKRGRGKATKHPKVKKTSVWTRRREDIIFFTVLFIIIGSIVGGYFIYEKYNRTEDNDGSNENDQPPDNNQPPTEVDWLDNYQPRYFVGSGENSWWIEYPDKHPNGGENINHLEWVKQDLDKKAVLLVVHKTGCGPCTPQAEKSGEIAEKYPDDLIFYDLDVVDGSETYNKGMETFMYDPDDAQNYIALTVVLTHIKDDSGKVSIAWHSWEGDMEKSVLESWVKDSIYHYNQK